MKLMAAFYNYVNATKMNTVRIKNKEIKYITSVEVKEKVELHMYSPSEPSWPDLE
jgi:hypothetical protein